MADSPISTTVGGREGLSRLEMVLWGAAGLVSLAVHVGGAAWVTREMPVEMADNAPPPAIMIELAAEPEAINTDANEISEQMENSLEMKSDTVEPVEQPEELVEQPTPAEIQPEQPVEEIAEAEPESVETLEPEPEPEPEPEINPVEEQILTDLENVEVPIPVIRPTPEEKKPVEKPKPKKQEVAKKPERKKPAPSSKASTEAAAQVRQSNRNAANQRTAGMGFGSASPAKWQSRLMAHLERRKRYPSGARSRGEQGTAYVRFRIDDAGNVLSASLARSSGFPDLDNEVVEMVRRASPVPAPPAGVNKTITAPVRFTVR
ncbi:cell envelope integrity protein TolA [Brucella pseudintermedia]|uniref:cell envelope integrity protein TolA n=1 Tax=Brucella pseudintermedia TaxID=370111 RepID=UPI00124C2DB8|nr:energy transducer TonB [Brucella pseudintermedia]KAB2678479.1 energy transducer TonB [Brucella pseudintermedia]